MTLKQAAFASKASQEGWEMWQMIKSLQEIKPKVIVEIGVDGGGSLQTWYEVFKPEILIGIDINDNSKSLENVLKKIPAKMLYEDSTKIETYDKLTKLLGNRKIDFLFLDGDHHFETVKREFELYASLVRLNGIIGFHDTNSRDIEGVEVGRFMKVLDKHYSYRTADFRLGQSSPGTRIIWR